MILHKNVFDVRKKGINNNWSVLYSSLVIHIGTSEDQSVVLVPGVVGDTEEQPGAGDGVGTQLRGV